MLDVHRKISNKTQKVTGRDVQTTNMLAARAISEVVKTTLGPKGMDKMLVDVAKNIVITNDGMAILNEIEVRHPVAKMLIEVAQAMEREVGDGTSTAVVISGELLKESEKLLDQGVHPSLIAKGFRLASKKASEILNSTAIEIDLEDEKLLKKCLVTTLTGKMTEGLNRHLADILVDAFKHVITREEGKILFDKNDIKLLKKAGGNIKDTKLVQGIVLEKSRVYSSMPLKVENAKIALLKNELKTKKTEFNAEEQEKKRDKKIEITSPNQLQSFKKEEINILKNNIEKIKASGANVLFCRKGIDELAQYYLAKEDIFALRWVEEKDIKRLAKATDANIITKIDELGEKDLGYAEVVEEIKGPDVYEEMVHISGCKNPKSVSILIRGGSKHVIEDVKRAIEDCLGVLSLIVKNKKVYGGGGAPEVEVAMRLRDYSNTIGSKEQLSVKAFADSLEIIPKSLAGNPGLDPIDILIKLRTKHADGGNNFGVDVFAGTVSNMFERGVIEPVSIKIYAIKTASEIAEMIIRIDSIIFANQFKDVPSAVKFRRSRIPLAKRFEDE